MVYEKQTFKHFVIYFTMVLLYVQSAYSQQDVTKDLSLQITLQSVVNSSNYTKFIKLTNNDDAIGVNDNLSVIVYVNLSNDYNYTFWSVAKTINSYSEAGFGTVSIIEGSYTLCVWIDALNFQDYIIENNLECKNITVYYSESLPQNYSGQLNESANYSFEGIFNSSANDSQDIYQDESGEILDTSRNDSVNMSGNLSNNYNNSSVNETVNVSINNSNNYLKNESNYSYADQSGEGINNYTVNQSDNSTALHDCSCLPQIETNKDIFVLGEKLEFNIIDCNNSVSSSKYNFPIEYWIEDGNEKVKSAVNTTSKAKKYYTPKDFEGQKYFVIKSRIEGCENASGKLIVFVNEDNLSRETNIEISSQEEISYENPGIYFMYVSVSGFKGDSGKTLLSVWLENEGIKFSEVTKIYVFRKNSYFDLKIPVVADLQESGEYEIVVEGLDEKEKNNIKINIINEEEKHEPEKELKDEEKGEITSFYTRKKTFDGEENLTFYISINYPDKKDILIKTDNNSLLLSNLSSKNIINISVLSENETIYAELYMHGALIDNYELKLNLTPSEKLLKERKRLAEKSEEKNETGNEKILISNASNYFLKDSITKKRELEEANISYEKNRITGNIVSTDSNKLTFLFMGGALVLCAILFSKKIREILFKKKQNYLSRKNSSLLWKARK